MLALALIASALLYLSVFSVVHRPLTTDAVGDGLRERSQYAKSLGSPKLLVWAGSNGRYSHRCETLAQITALPCANLSIAMGVGLDIQLMLYEPLLAAGDIVYMPLEYGQYRVERAEMESGMENTALVHSLQSTLWSLEPKRIARAYASFELGYLVHGLLEMGLSQLNIQRRAGSTELSNEHGDVVGHTAALASRYIEFIRKMPFDHQPLPSDTQALRVIEGFVKRARERGITVVAGLPTVPDNAPLDLSFVNRLQAMMVQHGQQILLLPNRSRYPLSCFYDTGSHLNEECQIDHSATIGRALLSAGVIQQGSRQ